MAKELNSDELVAEAQRTTGLQRFDSDSYREGLDILVADFNREAPAEVFVERNRRDIVAALANRLRVTAYLDEHPDLLKRPIEKPVFVFGMPRTGTTLLSNLLANDPARRSPLTWEIEEPVPPPTTAALYNDPRALARLEADRQMLAAHPDMGKYYRGSAIYPNECMFFMIHDFKGLLWEGRGKLPNYRDWLFSTDMTSTYIYHKRFLQLLQAYAPGVWNLKMPSHALWLETLLKIYPDARLVWTHRDPLTVVGSFCSLMSLSNRTSTDKNHAEWIAENYFWQAVEHADRIMNTREKLGHERIIDVHYADAVKNPIPTMRTLYKALGDEFTPEAEAGMKAWIADNPQDKFGKHEYKLKQFGLTEEQVLKRFERYLSQYDVEREGWGGNGIDAHAPTGSSYERTDWETPMTKESLDCSDIDGYLGKPIQGARLKDRLANNDIRRWAQAMHYPNRLHYDDDYAAESRFTRIVAPQSFAVATDDGHGSAPSCVGHIPQSHLIFGGDEWWFYGPRIFPGDLIHNERIPFDYVVKETKFAGPTCFQRGDNHYYNDRGDRIATQRSTSIRYRADLARKMSSLTASEDPEWSDEQLAKLEDQKFEYVKMMHELGHDKRYWDDVNVGDKLPTRIFGPHSIASLATEWRSYIFTIWGGMHRRTDLDMEALGFTEEMAGKEQDPVLEKENPELTDGAYIGPSRGHLFPRWARYIGMPRAYGYGASMGAWILDYLAGWAGEWGLVVHSNCNYRGPAHTGDITIFNATVVDKFVDDQKRPVAQVDFKMTNQLGTTMSTAKAEIELPKK